MSGMITLNAPSYMPALLGSSAPGASLLSSMRAGNGPAAGPTPPETGTAAPVAAEPLDGSSPSQMLTMAEAPPLDLVV